MPCYYLPLQLGQVLSPVAPTLTTTLGDQGQTAQINRETESYRACVDILQQLNPAMPMALGKVTVPV